MPYKILTLNRICERGLARFAGANNIPVEALSRRGVPVFNTPGANAKARQSGSIRLAIANDNVPNMVGQISTCLAEAHLNIAELLNRSRGEHAYTLIDAEGSADGQLLQRLAAIQGVRSVRLVHAAE